VATTRQLSDTRPGRIDADKVTRAERLVNERLAEHGGKLSAEQARALQAATGERQVVMIEGQAGTGKSTVLQAVALAHQADGRKVLVTSTGALAAKRLADDLCDVGVDARSYSTVALRRAIHDGRITLGPDVTVIHDEAALASTREQHGLHEAVSKSGARLVIVGDPRQSRPVGAGGLWPHLEAIASASAARVELTHNLRARHPEDRRDQALFRNDQATEALRGYATRNRIHAAPNQREAEQEALRAADADRRAGLRTLVVAQTSNDHLDQLNARAQRLRAQHGELGRAAVAVPGRPYALHPGDEVQVRRSLKHPEHGQIRNGSTATVGQIDSRAGSVTLHTSDGEIILDREQLASADVRLAYVQHPVPAQGATTDTAHLIAGEHATRDGTYVAITRARDQTHIYTGPEHLTGDTSNDKIVNLAEHLARDQPDVPSISTPLAGQADGTFTRRWERRVEAREADLEAREIEREDLGWEL
jgi:ATP-dependent exoDNAse (exonuclease V) alpha subunit